MNLETWRRLSNFFGTVVIIFAVSDLFFSQYYGLLKWPIMIIGAVAIIGGLFSEIMKYFLERKQ